MNVKEVFAKAENGTLTYEQFKAIVDENKSKFADLSEGHYVDKQKYTDELAARDTRITTLDETLKQRDADLSDLKTQLENAGQDANKLAEVTSQFTALQEKYDNDVKNYQNQLAKQKYEFAVKNIANNEKFTSSAAKNFFIQTLNDKNLSMEEDKIVGVDDFIKQYKEDNADSFVVEQPKEPETPPKDTNKLPAFAGPTGVKTTPEAPTNDFGFNFHRVR